MDSASVQAISADSSSFSTSDDTCHFHSLFTLSFFLSYPLVCETTSVAFFKPNTDRGWECLCSDASSAKSCYEFIKSINIDSCLSRSLFSLFSLEVRFYICYCWSHNPTFLLIFMLFHSQRQNLTYRRQKLVQRTHNIYTWIGIRFCRHPFGVDGTNENNLHSARLFMKSVLLLKIIVRVFVLIKN